MNYGVLITEDYKPIQLIRKDTEQEAEFFYQKYKEEGYNVIKIEIKKTHELSVISLDPYKRGGRG